MWKKPGKMTKYDWQLVFYCSENARIKLKELSALIDKSSQRLKYNLSQMEKGGITLSPHAIFDYSFFGLLLFRVYFRGGYIREKDKQKTLQLLQQHHSVVSVYELGGEFDMVIEMEAPNASRFNKELKKLIYDLPNLNNYKVVLNIVTHLHPRQYLLPPSKILPEKGIIVGGDKALETFDWPERLIIHSLLLCPKIRFARLAKEAGINIKTAIGIFKGLRKRKILRGFNYVIDTNKLGIHKYRLFCKLHNLSLERETALMEFCAQTPGIVQVNKTVGDWDMEIDIESLEKGSVRYLIARIREDFADMIESLNNMEFYYYYKKTYLPRSFFMEETSAKLSAPAGSRPMPASQTPIPAGKQEAGG